jgi:5-methylcytosine-specific restriction protein A
MSEWIIICNPNKYRVEEAFDNLKRIDWKQSTNVEVGDIAYIYEGKPISQIRHKCIVNKVNLSEIEIDDSEYTIDGRGFVNYKRHMELELIHKYKTVIPQYKELKEHGLTQTQGPSRASDKLTKFLNDCEKSDLEKIDINIPKPPKEIIINDDIINFVCGNCGYKFNKALRCPECGQLVKK